MKFTDGYWMLRPGLQALRPRAVDDVEDLGDALRVFARTRPGDGRGDTLNQALITVTLTSPAPDVIGVTIEHFRGGVERGPRFALTREPADVVTVVDERGASLTSGGLTARVRREGPWALDFLAGGRRLTGSADRSVGVVTDAQGRTFVHEQLEQAVGEHSFGLGERFGAFVKNGQSVDVWNADGGTSSEQAYKNVPFYLTDAGYGVFVDHPGLVSFEMGSEAVSRNQFSVEGQRLTYYVIHGPSPKDVLRRYTALTGRAPRVPAWSLGLWLSTSFTTDYDEATVTSFVQGMAERDIPLSVFHFDCFWMRAYHWCDFVWDPATFPDPEGMLARLRERGLRTSLWINPYVAQRSHLFDEGARLGHLVRRADGSVWQWDMWQAGMALVDFTSPAATAWFQSKLQALLDAGVDAFKTDFGERIPTDVVWHDGSDPEFMHNQYAQLYNAAVFEVLRRHRGEGEAVVFARAATAGGQQFPVHWGGDCESTFPAMAESLRGGLSLALSGFAHWSHDIGGFEGSPDPEVFKRWAAFGLLSSHSRLHGSGSYRVPWLIDEESVDVVRTFTRLKMRLVPYLLAAAEEAATTGVPIMRPMVLEFPDDPAAVVCDRQYLLGPDLLVAPVFSADGEVSYYLPEGWWTEFATGRRVRGGRWVRRRVAVDEVPLLVRPGAVVPVGAHADGPEYAWNDGVELRVFAPSEGDVRRVAVPAPGGGEPAVFEVRTRGGRTAAELVSGSSRDWRLVVVPDPDAAPDPAADPAAVGPVRIGAPRPGTDEPAPAARG
ncbi:alpha-D-xyloside xylohydrolase [Kineococcus radiotolerans]|uniref:alpha-D-xyloside xylohydrolase n=1 Tax=Kineococcus radiotolerans TaxID=131568 RepID=A0A7W4TL70_KINRA|nr:alpha-xylosidase [Kineococcus radiotolerans]MBB2900953.1 alpha-D-xyloside xylohydrolase [Kineococcus radiotolerans]